MAFRRVVRRRFKRRPVSRRRRFFRRRYKRGFRTSGNILIKCTKISEVNVPSNATSTWSCAFNPSDFPEIVGLYKNFEYAQFLRQRVRVMPLQNVANNSTSQVPGYCIFPWHHNNQPPTSKPFSSFLTIDKAKYRPQTRGVMMNFVPNIDLATEFEGPATLRNDSLQWKPNVALNSASGLNIRIFGGCIAFQGDSTAEGRTASFNIIQDVWVKFKNQSSLYL